MEAVWGTWIWAEDYPLRRAISAIPIMVQVKPGAIPVRINQRRHPWNIAMAIQKHLDSFLKYDIIAPIESPWNTRILPVPKRNGEYRPVQDLRVVNQATVTIHPVVPNPYVLLGLIPKEARWFMVLDLKDASFSIPIHHCSQPVCFRVGRHPPPPEWKKMPVCMETLATRVQELPHPIQDCFRKGSGRVSDGQARQDAVTIRR